jgi:hypothetical protein
MLPGMAAPRVSNWPLRLTALLLGLLSLGASCGQVALAIMPGVVNDPSNRSLRRALFSYAVDEICSEALKRSLALKLRDEDPTIGRFFPTSCQLQQLENDNLFIHFEGHGYAWTNVTGRMGFQASAAVEYDHDFVIEDGTMYVYFRQKQTQSTKFQVVMLEKTGEAGAAKIATGLFGGNLEQVTQQVGGRVLTDQLARGFTVVRESDGTATFATGVLEKGSKPPQPFARGNSDWVVLANDRTEIHSAQRDYTGPYTIEQDDQALHLTALVEGAPSVDVLVVAKDVGQGWIDSYEKQPAAAAPPGPALFDQALQVATPIPGGKPVLWRRALRLPVGSYYIVFDNTSTAGQTPAAGDPNNDVAALVSYGVQLGDAP